MRTMLLAILPMLLLAACGDEPDGGCEGEFLECTCSDGSPGTKTNCSAACVCETPACVLRHVEGLDFGAVPPGLAAADELVLTNEGEAVCSVSGFRLQGCGGELSLEAPTEASIPAGGVWPIPVRFEPMGEGEVACELTFEVSDPASAHRTVRLHGIGLAGCVDVRPEAIAFEPESAGCGTGEAAVLLTNRCGLPLAVESISVQGDPAFLALSVPPLPASLEHGESLQASMGFRPVEAGPREGQLRLDLAGLGPVVVPLAGVARDDRWVVDRQRVELPKLDVLFVVDNGTSMSDELAIAWRLDPFLQRLRAGWIDFQFGVTTSGLEPGGDCPGGVRGGEDGRLFPVDGSAERWLTRSTPDLFAAFPASLAVGACRDGPNAILEAAARALRPPVVDSADDPRHPEPDDGNQGFLRPEAELALVLVTDREDASPESGNYYVNAFLALKGFDHPERFHFAVITGDPETGCSRPPYGTAEKGDLLISVARSPRVDGRWLSICSPTLDGGLDAFPQVARSWRECHEGRGDLRVDLSEPPADVVIDGEIRDADGELEVRVDGDVVASTDDRSRVVWTYDAELNAVCFAGQSRPGYDSTIELRYRRPCQ